ncbi:DUF4238 domain-containing protein [Chloroflexota bacterium]
MRKTSQVKLEHYVPKLYLRNFAITDKKDHIYCFDKYTGKSFVTNIKNIASEVYFYETDKVDNKIEYIFGRFESHLKPIYDKLIFEQDINCLTFDEKKWIATFVALQALRTKQYQEMVRKWYEKIAGYAKGVRVSYDLEQYLQSELLKSKTEEDLKALHVGHFDMIENTAISLIRMIWTLVINDTDMSYWTSDHPVYPPVLQAWNAMQIQIPLSSKVSLFFSDLSIYGASHSSYIVPNVDKIIEQNSWQVMAARQYIFSDNANYSHAKNMIQKFPELRDITREQQYTFDVDLKNILSRRIFQSDMSYSHDIVRIIDLFRRHQHDKDS